MSSCWFWSPESFTANFFEPDIADSDSDIKFRKQSVRDTAFQVMNGKGCRQSLKTGSYSVRQTFVSRVSCGVSLFLEAFSDPPR